MTYKPRIKIKGKTYYHHSGHYYKTDANEIAKKLRKKGFNVISRKRILDLIKIESYDLFIRRK